MGTDDKVKLMISISIILVIIMITITIMIMMLILIMIMLMIMKLIEITNYQFIFIKFYVKIKKLNFPSVFNSLLEHRIQLKYQSCIKIVILFTKV